MHRGCSCLYLPDHASQNISGASNGSCLKLGRGKYCEVTLRGKLENLHTQVPQMCTPKTPHVTSRAKVQPGSPGNGFARGICRGHQFQSPAESINAGTFGFLFQGFRALGLGFRV